MGYYIAKGFEFVGIWELAENITQWQKLVKMLTKLPLQ
jgi:hypothetical protein